MNNLTLLKFWLEKQKVAYHKHDGFLEHPVAIKNHIEYFAGLHLRGGKGKKTPLSPELRNKIIMFLEQGFALLPKNFMGKVGRISLEIAPQGSSLRAQYSISSGLIRIFINPLKITDLGQLKKSFLHEVIHAGFQSHNFSIQDLKEYDYIIRAEGFYNDTGANAFYDEESLKFYKKLRGLSSVTDSEKHELDIMLEEDFVRFFTSFLLHYQEVKNFPKHVAFFKKLGLAK